MSRLSVILPLGGYFMEMFTLGHWDTSNYLNGWRSKKLPTWWLQQLGIKGHSQSWWFQALEYGEHMRSTGNTETLNRRVFSTHAKRHYLTVVPVVPVVPDACCNSGTSRSSAIPSGRKIFRSWRRSMEIHWFWWLEHHCTLMIVVNMSEKKNWFKYWFPWSRDGFKGKAIQQAAFSLP